MFYIFCVLYKAMIRVGTTHKNKTTPSRCLSCDSPNTCSHPNKFTSIWVTNKSKSGRYLELSPYSLADSDGHIMENLYQFSKIYRAVPSVKERLHFASPTVIWEWPTEGHIDTAGNVAPEYWNWRQKGMDNPYPVRYPAGYRGRTQCVGVLRHEGGPLLDYIEARKKIYVPIYTTLVKDRTMFKQLQHRLQNGENLLIIDVDGPKAVSSEYYHQKYGEKYGVGLNWIERDSIEITPDNLQILLNDPKHPFGHGFCLAAALLGYDLTNDDGPDA